MFFFFIDSSIIFIFFFSLVVVVVVVVVVVLVLEGLYMRSTRGLMENYAERLVLGHVGERGERGERVMRNAAEIELFVCAYCDAACSSSIELKCEKPTL